MKEMTTKEVQQMSLDILQDFHDFCVKNNLHYSLSGGTLLGAIRHNGFIPWDDDIDVQMPRPDYDRLIRTYTSEKGYKVYSRELFGFDKKKMAYTHARICDTQKTYVDTGIRPWISEQVGVWIDILPCDGISSNPQEAKKHLQQIDSLARHAYWMGVQYSAWSTIIKGKNLKEKVKFGLKKIASLGVKENVFDTLFRYRHKYNYATSEFFFATTHYGMKEWQPKKNLEGFILHKFEDHEFYIMSGWDENLKSLYGDYMKLPPENQRESHDFNRYYWK